MPTLIFLCVANSARSQMAEGLGRASAPDGWTIFSAGSRPGALHPTAVAVMREIGIDIGLHWSKGLDSVPLASADIIITLCAEEECPVLPPGSKRLHWPLPDPVQVAADDQLGTFRAVRDELRSRVGRLWREPTVEV